jgi:hypothetical protein
MRTDDQIKSEETISHISFDDMVEYVFSNKLTVDFVRKGAKINNHVMNCPECYRMYLSLMDYHEKVEQFLNCETGEESIIMRILSFLFSEDAGRPIESILEECRRFRKWIAFSVKNFRELVQGELPGFSHPRLATVMKSASGKSNTEEVESEILSSLFDKAKNRVSIGLDGTLSLYFDAKNHSVGQRVIIMPDDPNKSPQMLELTMYDDSITHVRFEGINPGQYTVLLET